MATTRRVVRGKAPRTAPKVVDLPRAEALPDKPLPHDLAAEQRIVGLLILDQSIEKQVPAGRDFYHPGHALIVSAVRALIDQGRPVDVDTIAEAAEELRPGILPKMQQANPLFLVDLTGASHGCVVGRDAETIKACAVLRRQLEMLEQAALDIRQRGGESPREVLELNRAMLRDADSVTTDARRAIVRGSDVEIGRALLELLRRGGERLVHDLGSFWRYDPARGIWRRLHSSEVEQAAQTLDGLAYGEGEVLSLSQHKINGALKCAAAQVAKPGWFGGSSEEDATPPPAGLCFDNGFVCVTVDGIELRQHSPHNRCTAALPFSYHPSETCHRWIKFLGEVFRDDEDGGDKARTLQEFTGASLLGIATRYGKSVLMFGGGRNGKGVAMDVVMSVFPKGSIGSIPPQSLDDLYSRAMLAPLLLNAVAEMPSAEILASEPLKSAITGDSMMGRNPTEKPFSFRPRAGHLYAANKLPTTVDHTVGFFERFVVLRFNRYFAENEREPGLAEKIITQEQAGIAAWALAGALALIRRRHYESPASSESALDKWRDSSDQVRQFVEERCVRTNGDEWVQSSELYRDYRAWGERNGHRVVNSNTFSERLEGMGLQKVNRAAGRFWPLRLMPGPVA